MVKEQQVPNQPTRTSGTYSAKGSGETSQYDSIKEHVRHTPSNVHRATPRGATSTVKPGDVVRAAPPSGGGLPGDGTPALPKPGRTYGDGQTSTGADRG